MKIAHITTIDLSLRYLLLNQLQSLQAAGYEVIGISAPGPDVPLVEAAGVRHIAVSLTRRVTPFNDLKALLQLVRVLRRERPTIVHCHTPKAELLGQVAARLAGVPLVVDTFRGIYYRPDMRPLWRRLFILMAKVAAGRADVVLSQSREAMEMAIREGICPPHKIIYLGNGIDIQQFSRPAVDADKVAELRQSLLIPPGVPVVGFVGRLVQEKGLPEYLQAGRIIRQQFPNVRFLIVGPIDSEKEDNLNPTIAQDYGLANHCIFTGLYPPEDMPTLLALMDIFVLPTHRESFPRSPMEASAMSIPCILTDIPGCREVVTHGQNGFLIPLGDADALAEAALTLLTHQDTARRMGVTGRHMAEQYFDEQRVFARVKQEYARLLQQKGLAIPEPQREDIKIA